MCSCFDADMGSHCQQIESSHFQNVKHCGSEEFLIASTATRMIVDDYSFHSILPLVITRRLLALPLLCLNKAPVQKKNKNF